MKKLIPIVFIFALVSCAKQISTDGGSWTLNSLTYKATQAYWVQGGIAAYTGTNVPSGSLALWFCDTVGGTPNWPPHLHTYTMCKSYPPAYGQVFMQLTDTSIRNSYTITGTTTPTITVDTTSKGLHIFTIPPVEVVNTNDSIQLQVPPFSYYYIGKPSGTDSSLVTGTILQTQ